MSRRYVDHHAIEFYSDYSKQWFFYEGYKTLPTLRKKYNKIVDVLKVSDKTLFNRVRLVSRDYDRQVVKVICSFSK